MNDREKLARLNALLVAGISLQDAERVSGCHNLGGWIGKQYMLIRELCLRFGAAPTQAMAELQAIAVARAEADARLLLAAAMPRSSARLVQWLPLATLFLAQLAGFGSLDVLLHSWLAAISCVIGLCFLVLANIASSRMIAKAHEVPEDYSIVLDAFAMCLRAGLSTRSSREKLSQEFQKVFQSQISTEANLEVDGVFELSQISGAPIEKLLRARAKEIRFNMHQNQLQRLERLSVRLLIPLAIFVLPAFIFISVIPISISLLSKN